MQKKMRSFLCLLLSLAMLLGLCMLPAAADGPSGNWSDYKAESFYSVDNDTKTIAITSEAELALLASNANSDTNYQGWTVTLTKDLDLSAHYWTPIGNNTWIAAQSQNMRYAGIFDGDNHTVSGLTINTSDSKNYWGLFGYLAADGAVKNLNVSGAVNVSYSSGTRYIGGLVGYTESANIYNVCTDVAVTADLTGSRGTDYTGGLAGYAKLCSGGVFTECTNKGAVTGYAFVGGLFGSLDGTGLERCGNTGAVTMKTKSTITTQCYAGGLAGKTANLSSSGSDPTFTQCYNSGAVSVVNGDTTGSYSANGAGGLFGLLAVKSGSDLGLAWCYNTGDVTDATTYHYPNQGGLFGEVKGPSGSSNAMTLQACYNAGTVAGGAKNGGFLGYVSSAGGPINISDCYCLKTAVSSLFGAANANIVCNNTETAMLEAAALKSAVTDGKLPAAQYKDNASGFPVLSWQTDSPAAVTAASIAVSGYKTDYHTHDSFSKTGIVVTATMSDATTQNVTAFVKYAGFDSTTAGVKPITVTYGGLSTTFDVTVSAPDSIAVSDKSETEQYKKEYFVGEPLSTTNIVVTATTGATEWNVPLADVDFTGFESETAGDKTVTVTYKYAEKSTTFTVKVSEAPEDLAWYFKETNNSFTITTAAELARLAKIVKGTDEIVPQTNFSGKTITLGNDVTLSGEWTPIGCDASHPFSGAFDGGHHTVSGLQINAGTDDEPNTTGYLGLFGYVSGNSATVVKNLTVSGAVNVVFKGANAYVGGVIGYGNLAYATITDLISDVDVTVTRASTSSAAEAASYVGGVVGYAAMSSSSTNANNMPSWSGCANLGDVTGPSYVGGLAGFMQSKNTTNCYNWGKVTRADASGAEAMTAPGYVGGLAGCGQLRATTQGGQSSVVMDNKLSYNSGAVTDSVGGTDSAAGGLFGWLKAFAPNQWQGQPLGLGGCYNSGVVTGAAYAGGLAGRVENSAGKAMKINQNYNSGAVTGAEGKAGALFGVAVSTSGGIMSDSDNYFLTGTAASAVAEDRTNNNLTSFKSSELTSDELKDAVVDDKLPTTYFMTGALYPILTWQTTYDVEVSGSAKDDVTASEIAVEHEAYSFTLTKDGDYDYTVSATVGGAAVTLTEDNSAYTIAADAVTGALAITAERALKTFAVTVSGSAKDDVTAAATATIGTDYSFTVTKDANYDYTVSAKVGDTAVTLTKTDEGYTVAADAVTGAIAITANKTAKTYGVTVSGSATADVSAATTATAGTAFSFTVNKDANYNYTVTATVGGTAVTVTENGSTYTIAAVDVTGAIAITANKTVKTYGVTVSGSAKNDVTAATTATALQAFSFTVTKAEGYDYEIAVTVGGTEYTPTVSGSTYTIAKDDVTGAIAITANKTIKTYAVTVSGSATADVSAATTATAGAAYSFTVTQTEGYDYEIAVTVGGTDYTPSVSGSTYTVAAKDVTGAIVITANKTEQTPPPPATYDVTVSGNAAAYVTAPDTATAGEAFTFTLKKDENYTYTVSAKVGGASVDVAESGAGYTIAAKDVTGAIAITATMTEKGQPGPTTYAVTVSGSAAGDVTAETTATEGTAFSFTMTKAEGYDYTVSATVGGEEVELAESGSTYTVAAADVTGAIAITANKTVKTYAVTVSGSAAADVTAAATATAGTAYSFTVTEDSNYDYTVTVTVGGTAYTPSVSGSTYTIAAADVTGAIAITATKTEKPAPAPTAVSIAVSGDYKKTYEIGEAFDKTGIVVTATMSDQSTVDVTADTAFSGFDSATAGEKTITAACGELKTTFKVTVNAAAVVPYDSGSSGSSTPGTATSTEKDESTFKTADGSTVETATESTVETKKNADGSVTETTTTKTTETVTDAAGNKTVTEMKEVKTVNETADGKRSGTVESTAVTTQPDGSKTTAVTTGTVDVTTDKDGTVTEVVKAKTTTTAADGAVTEQNTVTTTAVTADGTTGTVVADAQGNTLSAEIVISKQAIEKALAGKGVVKPPITVNAASGATVRIRLEGALNGRIWVEIGTTKTGPGIVGYLKQAGGLWKLLKSTKLGSVIVPVTGDCEIAIRDNTKAFRDLDASAWYNDSVIFVTAREIFNGNGDGTFAPGAKMNRAMVAQMLYNFDESAAAGDGTSFSDVKAEDWFNAAVGWAAKLGVITGYDGVYAPLADITRQDLVTILYRYAKQAGYVAAGAGADVDLAAYADGAEVSDYAAEAMRWAISAGIIGGYEDGTLRPLASATRAEVAAIMQRMVQNAVK